MLSYFELFGLLCIHAVALLAAAHVLLTKRDPRSALGWSAALAFLPVVGLIAYLIFGINRAQSRAEKIMRHIASVSSHYAKVDDLEPQAMLPSKEARTLDGLARRLTGLSLCAGNSIEPLHNGDEAYPAMIEAINQASSHVFLSTYIFNYGHAARSFINALGAAHKRGVDVRVLVDGVGYLYSWIKPLKILKGMGIKTTRFRPFTLFPPNFGINLRSHRKVMICDHTAFTGGMNIADGDLLNYQPYAKGKIQDVQFKCKGPIVSELCRAFMLNWSFCTNEFMPLPILEEKPAGDCACRVVVDGPGDDADALLDLICGAINTAQKSVLMMTPYFMPPERLKAAMRSAGQRGVEVCLIIPGHNNLAYMSWAMDRILPELMRCGVRVWRQAPPFAHTKLLAIDGFYCLVGSANMDARSLLLNFELNLEIYNEAFHDKLAEFMRATMRKGKEASLAELESLSLGAKLRNAVIWIFSPYL